jgi:hypothetical protein
MSDPLDNDVLTVGLTKRKARKMGRRKNSDLEAGKKAAIDNATDDLVPDEIVPGDAAAAAVATVTPAANRQPVPPKPKSTLFEDPELKVLAPNKPSFDWVEEDGEKRPNLFRGEDITDQGERRGIPFVRTTRQRFIFLCDGDTYEKEFGLITNRALWEAAFPNAFPNPRKLILGR